MSTSKFKGILEIDNARGVIYFHLSKKDDIETLEVVTLLRICNLPKISNDRKGEMDIIHMRGTNWDEIH